MIVCIQGGLLMGIKDTYLDNLKNKFGSIILEKCTESYLYFTTEINSIDRFTAFLGIAYTDDNIKEKA